MRPQIISQFITADERWELIAWAHTMRPYLHPNGPARYFKRLSMLRHVPVLCMAIRGRIARTLALDEAQLEPRFENYLSTIEPGGAIHPHRDAAPDGFEHWRCNLFLQLPETGGYPVVEGNVYPVKEQDLLYFTPDQHTHWCEPVGPGKRIIVSYGFLLKKIYQRSSTRR